MTPEISQVLPNLGVAGFALFILWKMYDASQKRLKEKDQEVLAEIDKRDKRNEESQKVFNKYAEETQRSMMKHINDNTNALSSFTAAVHENTKVTHALSQHLAEHHPSSMSVLRKPSGRVMT